jgi:hypothetical protein
MFFLLQAGALADRKYVVTTMDRMVQPWYYRGNYGGYGYKKTETGTREARDHF